MGAGRVSTYVFVAAALLAIGGAYVYRGSPSTLDVARIDDWRRDHVHGSHTYQITGRLADGAGVGFSNAGDSWRCAPLISDRADAGERPMAFFSAPASRFERARASSRFVGRLYLARWGHPGVQACRVPSDGYVLVDDGNPSLSEVRGRSMLIVAAVIGAIAFVAFLASRR